MRITTNMMMRNYQNNLTSTLSGLDQSRRQVESGRRFSRSSQDPLAAAKGEVLKTRYARNADYTDAVDETQKWQDTQEDVLMQVGEMASTIDKKFSMEALNATSGEEGRSVFAKGLRELQQSMVYSLNTKYGDSYVMAGSDGSNAPFQLGSDGKLLYRGLDVNDPANATAMKKFSQETAYVDLGFGLSFDQAGDVVSSSAFNSANPGINVVGYGQTADGTSKNIIVLAGEMADVLDKEPFDQAKYEKLWKQFGVGAKEVQNQVATIGTKSQLLETTKDRLTSEKLSIVEQIDGTLGIDEAEAITNYSWSQYVYNVALKIGTGIIGSSLLDFMK